MPALAKTVAVVVAIYVRISRDRKGEMLGVERQRPPCIELVERYGWTVGEIYTDNDVSAYSGKRRPDYERMCADLRAGAVNAVVVWRDDRLHRNPRELEDFIDLIESTGAEIRTVMSGDHDLTTADGRLKARIVCSFARHESEVKSERLRLKHLELAQAGKVSGGGTRPFGFEADGVTVRESEAAEVRAAVRRVLAGDTVRSVATDWNERVPTVTGAGWSVATVRDMLKSARLSGQREHKGAIVGPAEWPAIIPPDDTARLRAILDRPSTVTDRARSYLLSGFLVCGECDNKLVARPNRRWRRYACTKDGGGCGGVSVSATGLDALIERLVWAVFASPDYAAAQSAQLSDAADDDAYAEAALLDAKLEQLARDHYVDAIIDRPQFLAAQAPLRARLVDARKRAARRRPVDALAGIASTGLEDAWPGLSLGRRRAIIGSVIESVKVGRPTKPPGGRTFDTDRVLGPGDDRGIVWKV